MGGGVTSSSKGLSLFGSQAWTAEAVGSSGGGIDRLWNRQLWSAVARLPPHLGVLSHPEP